MVADIVLVCYSSVLDAMKPQVQSHATVTSTITNAITDYTNMWPKMSNHHTFALTVD